MTRTLLVLLGLSLTPSAFAQAYCAGTFGIDGDVVLGTVRGTTHLGICRRAPSGVVTFFDVPSCHSGTAGLVRISLSGSYTGTSRVAPLVKPIDCAGTWLDPWSPGFTFGLWATGYTAVDEMYGTPNRDWLFANSDSAAYSLAHPDGAYDTLCGYDGDDELIGDPGVAPPGACLDGGPEVFGDACTDGDEVDCETLIGITPPASSCGCGSMPPDIW